VYGNLWEWVAKNSYGNFVSFGWTKAECMADARRYCRIENVRDDRERKKIGDGAMRKKNPKTIWAYLDGRKLVDVVQAALDNHMMVDDMKDLLVRENPGHEVTFRCD
jgi:hypothetical protein